MSVSEPTEVAPRESTLSHLLTSLLYTVATVVVLGFIYPAVITLIGMVVFPHQAAGSLVRDAHGTVVGSQIIGQLFTKPQYFHGRPSAAGKNGYDPTATGGTNLAPTSHKLIDATRATIRGLHAEDSMASEPPIDLVTSSGSGIDPDISPEAAQYQVTRVAAARHLSRDVVASLVNAQIVPRALGFLGEPRVNVLELNRALDAYTPK
jgi:K+-transporting ATPase ATPase C chain